MRISDLDYELPSELIAQEPLAARDASRLLVVDVPTSTVEHHEFAELPALLAPSLFVFNDTRVFPARLRGRKPTGGQVELFLLERLAEPDRWLAMGKASKGIQEGLDLELLDGRLRARVVAVREQGHLEVQLEAEESLETLIETHGEVPLPPYIRRSADDADRTRYQTVYAKNTGAVAAPTAGLHFTEDTLGALEAAGHRAAYLTLHVGPGTFRPIQTDELVTHPMHEEACDVPAACAKALEAARREGRAVVAVGTTVVRALEASVEGGAVVSGRRRTDLFIRPPFDFQVVDHLLTNFHLPRSTLLALVMALAGVDLTRRAYASAVERRYRFYSYGDAMLIRGGRR